MSNAKREEDQINLTSTLQVQRWVEQLRVSEQELRDAVREVGHSEGKVRQYLSHAGAVI